MSRLQKTINAPVRFMGKGLHSGRIVQLEVLPAAPGAGIIFQRTDTEGAIPILAHALNISSTELSTKIGRGGNSISTVEHLMAAFAGMGIDNALVRLNGPEVPVMDGSSLPFVMKFQEVGLKVQTAKKTWYKVKKAFEVRNGDQFIRVEPSNQRVIKCSIQFKNSVIGFQAIDFKFTANNFSEICKARTFCHANDVKVMKSQGLALGGSLDNAVVVTDTEVMNSEGLRYNDEFVRHKLLDLIGDLALLGHPLLADITAHKPGHTLHAQFMTEILTHKEQLLAEIELDHDAAAPVDYKTQTEFNPIVLPAFVN